MIWYGIGTAEISFGRIEGGVEVFNGSYISPRVRRGMESMGFGWTLCSDSIEAKAARHDVPAGCSVRWRGSGSQVLDFFAFASSGPLIFAFMSPHLVESTPGWGFNTGRASSFASASEPGFQNLSLLSKGKMVRGFYYMSTLGRMSRA